MNLLLLMILFCSSRFTSLWHMHGFHLKHLSPLARLKKLNIALWNRLKNIRAALDDAFFLLSFVCFILFYACVSTICFIRLLCSYTHTILTYVCVLFNAGFHGVRANGIEHSNALDELCATIKCYTRCSNVNGMNVCFADAAAATVCLRSKFDNRNTSSIHLVQSLLVQKNQLPSPVQQFLRSCTVFLSFASWNVFYFFVPEIFISFGFLALESFDWNKVHTKINLREIDLKKKKTFIFDNLGSKKFLFADRGSSHSSLSKWKISLIASRFNCIVI